MKSCKWKGYVTEYNKECNEWETMYRKHLKVWHKTIAGIKRKILKLEDNAHTAMLSHFGTKGYDCKSDDFEWKHFGD